MSIEVRAGRLGDLPGIREVCIRTGDAGQDASGSHPDDGILPDLYADPYVRLEPDLVFVAADGGRVVGYVLGTADTDAFATAWRERWLPIAAARHPDPPANPTTAYEHLVTRLHRPEDLRTPWIEDHPAHLHVDLLPEARGHGLGRALVERFCEAVAERGARGVHLGVARENARAEAFYRHLGFRTLDTGGGATWLGRRC